MLPSGRSWTAVPVVAADRFAVTLVDHHSTWHMAFGLCVFASGAISDAR